MRLMKLVMMGEMIIGGAIALIGVLIGAAITATAKKSSE